MGCWSPRLLSSGEMVLLLRLRPRPRLGYIEYALHLLLTAWQIILLRRQPFKIFNVPLSAATTYFGPKRCSLLWKFWLYKGLYVYMTSIYVGLIRACSTAVEHTPWNQNVKGSNPAGFLAFSHSFIIFSYFPSPVKCPESGSTRRFNSNCESNLKKEGLAVLPWAKQA